MGGNEDGWEKELAKPISDRGANPEWMAFVEGKVMRKKHAPKKRIPLVVGLLTVIVVLAVIVTNSNGSRSLLPDGDHIHSASDIPLVEGKGIQIWPEEFFLYKSGMEAAYRFPQFTSYKISDQQIIDNLIIHALTLQYADKMGLKVSSAEIDKEVAFQRNSLEEAASDDNRVKELMANRIHDSGLSEDEFWNSELTRGAYEESLLIGKLQKKINEEGTIEGGDGYGFDNFQKELVNKNKDKLTINWSTIKGNEEAEQQSEVK